MVNNYKFQELMNYFMQLKGNEIRLTYEDIENILGFKLRDSAYKYKQYWYATKTHTITRAWTENKWEISDVELGKYIIFKRV